MVSNLTNQEKWKDAVLNYRWWFESGKTNLQIADFLYDKYLEANNVVEDYLNNGKGKSINKDDYSLWSNIHKRVLIFYGFAVECYLKGLITDSLKEKILTFNEGRISFSRDFLKHINCNSYKNYENIFPVINKKEEKYIMYLFRAVHSGKYPFEKSPQEKNSMTSELDDTIKFAKKLIRNIVIVR